MTFLKHFQVSRKNYVAFRNRLIVCLMLLNILFIKKDRKKRAANLFQQLQMQKLKPQINNSSANTQQSIQSDITEVDRRRPYLILLQKQARGKAIQNFVRFP